MVDRLTKYGHFVALSHPYTAARVAQIFLKEVFKLHGLPKAIISDRDPVFLSSFWKTLFELQGSLLNYDSAYHPETDGQTEALNKCLEGYLRCYAGAKPKGWVQWLPMAKWWYNTSYHTSTKLSPFEALYGYPPPKVTAYVPSTASKDAADQLLRTHDQIRTLLKENLDLAQQKMKLYAYRKRTEREFKERDWVYLRLQPYHHVREMRRRSVRGGTTQNTVLRLEERIVS